MQGRVRQYFKNKHVPLFHPDRYDNVPRLAVGELVGIAQFNSGAVFHASGDFHPQLFTPPNKVFFRAVRRLLAGQRNLVADFGAARWLGPTEYLLQVCLLYTSPSPRD